MLPANRTSAHDQFTTAMRKPLAILTSFILIASTVVLGSATLASPANAVTSTVTTWQQLRAAISDPTVDVIELGADILRDATPTNTTTDLPLINRTLTVDGKGFSLDFRPGGGTTVIARSGFQLASTISGTSPATFTLTNIDIRRPNGGVYALINGQYGTGGVGWSEWDTSAGAVNATKNWIVDLSEISHSLVPSSGLATVAGATIRMHGNVSWDSTTGTNSNTSTINARQVIISGSDTNVSLRNNARTNDDHPLVIMSATEMRNSFIVNDGAKVFLENLGTARTQVVSMLAGTTNGTISEFIVDGEGTDLEIKGWGAGTDTKGATVTMTAAPATSSKGGGGGFKITGGATMNVHAARPSNGTNHGMPGLIQEIDGGEFIVDGEGSILTVRSDGADNDYAGAVRIRIVGNQTLKVSNLGTLTVYRPFRNTTLQAPGIRFGDGQRNSCIVESGGLILVRNEGSNTISTVDNSFTNAAVVFNAPYFNFDVSGGKMNSEGEWIPSAIELIADRGPAIGGGSANGSITVGDGAVFLAEGNVNAAQANNSTGTGTAAVISAGDRFSFTTNSPQYYNFMNTNPRTGALVFSTGAYSTYQSIDTDVAVWGNGINRMGTAAVTPANSSFNPVDGDPYKSWTLADFSLSGANFPTLVSTADSTFNMGVDSYGSRGMVPYHRVSGNNAPPTIREMIQPTNADLYVRATGTVAEGLDFRGRPVWTDEVWSRWTITDPNNVTTLSGQGDSSSVHEESLYTVEEDVETLYGTVRYTSGDLLVTDTTYELTSAWRGPYDDPDNTKKHAADPAKHILTSPVTVIDVMPPVPATITNPSEILVGGTNTVTGTWLVATDQAIAEPNNPDPAVKIFATTEDGSTTVPGTLNADGTWEVELPTTLTDSLASGDKIFFVLADALNNANPLVDTPFHDTTKLAAPYLSATLAKILAEDFTVAAFYADQVMGASDRDAQLIDLAGAVGRANDSDPLTAGAVEVVSVGIPTPATPGDYPVTFRVIGKPAYTITITATVTDDVFSCGDSSFAVSPVVSTTDNSNWMVANGSDFYTGTFTAIDEDGNPMAKLSGIHFSASSSNVDHSSMVNHGDGTYTVTYSSLVADPSYTAKVEVAFDGDTCQVGSVQPIPFKTGSLDQGKSTFTVHPAASTSDKTTWMVADGVDFYTGTLTAVDGAMNPLTSLTGVVFAASSADVNLTGFANNGDGTYTVKFTTTKASGSYTASVSVQGLKIGTDQPIPFKAGEADPDPDCPGRTGTHLWVEPNNDPTLSTDLVSGDVAQVSALITDANCNPVEDVVVDFLVDPSNVGLLGNVFGTTDEFGMAFAELSAADPGTANLIAKIDVNTTPTHIKNSPWPVTVTAGTLDSVKSDFAVEQCDTNATKVVADGMECWKGILTARDSRDNLITTIPTSELDALDWVVPQYVTKSSPLSTDNAGHYWVQYTSKVAGDYTVKLMYSTTKQIGSDETITFASGDPSEGPCIDEMVPPREGTALWTDTPSTGVGTQAEIKARITDNYCNPIADQSVSYWLVAGSSATFVDGITTGTTGSDGITSVKITDNVAETARVNATSGSISFASNPDGKNAPVSVTFTVGDVDPGMSLFTVSKCDAAATRVIADGVGCWKGTVTPKDSLGNTVAASPAQLAGFDWGVYVGATPTDLVTVSGVANNGDGTYSVTYTTTKSGDYHVDLRYNGGQIGGTEQITFFAGVMDPNNSDLTVNPTQAVAGDKVTITITARDTNMNPITNLPSTDLQVQGQGAGLPNMTIDEGPIPGDPGVYNYRGTSFKVGTFEVSGSVGGIMLTQRPTVRFVAGETCLRDCTTDDPSEQTRFEEVTNGALANGVMKNVYRAWAFDTYGNAVGGATVQVLDTTTSAALAGKMQPPVTGGVTNAQGWFTIEWTSTEAGMYSASGSIGGLGSAFWPTFSDGANINGGIISNIEFTGGDVDAQNSTLTVDKTSPQTVGVDYELTATIMGMNTLPKANVQVYFTFDKDPTPASMSAPTCTTDATGQCSITVASTKVEQVVVAGKVSVGGTQTPIGKSSVPATSSPKNLAWTADVLCTVAPCLTRAVVEEDYAKADGTSVNTIRFYAFDRYDNPLVKPVTSVRVDTGKALLITPSSGGLTNAQGELLVRYSTTVKGTHEVTAKIDGVDVPVENYGTTAAGMGIATLHFTAGTAVASRSWLELDPVGPQEVGSTYTVIAHLMDANNNPAEGTVVFPAVANLIYAAGQMTCDADTSGTCSVQVTTTKAGSYDISGTIDGVAVSNSPVTARFTAGAPCFTGACKSKVTVYPNGVKADGTSRDIATVEVFDSYDNPIPGLMVTSVAANPSQVKVQPTGGVEAIQPTDTEGKTTIWYTSTFAGDHQASILINGTPMGSWSPITVSFTNGDVSAEKSSYTVTPLGPLVVGNTAVSMYTVEATARDINENLVGGAVVSFQINPDGPVMSSSSCSTSTVAGPALGTCRITIYSTVAGTYSLTATVIENNNPTNINNSDTLVNSTSLQWNADDPCVEGCSPDISTPPSKWSRVEVEVNNQLANNSARDIVRVYVFDKWGNPASAIVSTKPSTGLNAQSSIAGPNSAGETTIWYTSAIAGDHTATVMVDYDKGLLTVAGSPVTLTFVAGAPCVGPDCPESCDNGRLGSRIEGAEGYGKKVKVTAGDTTEIRALITDANCNPLEGEEVTFSHDSSDALFSSTPPVATTGANGWATISLTDKVAELVLVEGAISTGEKIYYGSPVEVEFGVGGACVGPQCRETCDDGREGSRIYGDKYGELTTREAGQPANVYARVTDMNCNPIPGATVNFTKTPANPATFTPASTAVTDNNGIATLVLNDKKAETVDVSGSVSGVTIYWGNPAQFKFTAGEPATECTMPDGTPGIGTHISADPTSAAVGGTSLISAYVADEYCNPIEAASVRFTVDGQARFTTSPATVLTGADGYARITVTDEKAETVNVTGVVNGSLAIETGSPAQVTFLAGNIDPQQSSFTVTQCDPSASKVVADGEDCWKGTVAAFDSRGNPLPGLSSTQLGMLQWNVDTKVTKSAVVDHGDGTYTINYTSVTAGAYTVNVMYNSNPVAQIGKDETITFTPGEPCVGPECPTTCVDGRPGSSLSVTPTSLTIDDTAAVVVLITDKTCNPVPGVAVSLSVTGQAWLGATAGTTGDDGLVTTTLGDLKAETVKVHASIAQGTVPSDTDVTFHVGAFDPASSDFVVYMTAGNQSADKVRADGVESWTGELIPKDKGGNLITTPLTPALVASLSTKVDSTVVSTSGPAGTNTWLFTSTTYGKTTDVSLYVDGVRIPHGVKTISFTRAVPPEPPVITEPSEGDQINTSRPPVSGDRGEPGSTIKVKDENGNVLCTTVADAEGKWGCTPTKPLPDGDHELTVTATDPAGNESNPSDPINITIDTVPPSEPIVDPTNGSKVTGSAEPGSKVTVRDKGNKPVPGCTDVLVEADGRFTCEPKITLEPGDTITVTAKDAAGNESKPVKVTVRGLEVEVMYTQRYRGEEQIVVGRNFNPGETVSLVVYSDPFAAGTAVADPQGTVVISFIVPGNMEYTTHIVRATGNQSGSTETTFQVTPPPVVIVPTGGTVLSP